MLVLKSLVFIRENAVITADEWMLLTWFPSATAHETTGVQKILEYKELLGHRDHRIMADMDKEKTIEKICDYLHEQKSPYFSNCYTNESERNFAH